MRPLRLAMSGRQHRTLAAHLFPGDDLEAAAILVCNPGTGLRSDRLLVAEVLRLPHSESVRRADALSWPFADHLPPERISEVDRAGQSLVTIHSHPNGARRFSFRDDATDRELFTSVGNWFDDGRPNGSAIMLPDGRVRARQVDSAGRFREIDAVSVAGEAIRVWKRERRDGEDERHEKLAQTFGRGTVARLRDLRVGVVGCSGTGSVIVEMLARNSVGALVLVDPDLVEPKNLNRILNATADDARERRPKVDALRRALLATAPGAEVETYQSSTAGSEAARALVDCDVVFGCVDTAAGRYHLDCLASAYFLPYFDVGVYLEADGEGGIAAADAVAHYIHPDGESLLSRGGYTMERVTAENWLAADPAHYERQRVAGYLEEVGEEQPAVLSVNMQAACLAFNDFLARIHPFRLDDDREFGTQRLRLVHGCHESEADEGGPHPLFERWRGAGDRSLLVRNNLVDAGVEATASEAGARPSAAPPDETDAAGGPARPGALA